MGWWLFDSFCVCLCERVFVRGAGNEEKSLNLFSPKIFSGFPPWWKIEHINYGAAKEMKKGRWSGQRIEVDIFQHHHQEDKCYEEVFSLLPLFVCCGDLCGKINFPIVHRRRVQPLLILWKLLFMRLSAWENMKNFSPRTLLSRALRSRRTVDGNERRLKIITRRRKILIKFNQETANHLTQQWQTPFLLLVFFRFLSACPRRTSLIEALPVRKFPSFCIVC